MPEEEKLVAIVSPWGKLAELVKTKFRVESLPAEKRVMVWRDDLQTAEKLTAALASVGVSPAEISKRSITNWKEQR